MSTATLRTGDIKKFSAYAFYPDDHWAVIFDDRKECAFGTPTRKEARDNKASGERIARVLSRTKKTVTVEITK